MAKPIISDLALRTRFSVSNKIFGPGFLEKVYENALVIELKDRKLNAKAQMPIQVIISADHAENKNRSYPAPRGKN